MSSTSSPSVSEVDAAVWRAVAGASFQIPPLNSYVYYFPQGHLEQHSSASVENQNIGLKRPFIPCQVLSVRLLSNPSSDQVFVKFLLQPLHAWEKRLNCSVGDINENDVVSFAKVLTPSDANNGGGFSVPRFCADSIFPPLNFASDPPVQNLIMKDTHNNAWEFRHIYRGTPRRHLLTTGWSKFVNAKRLIAGDSVVFMRKKSTNELFTGIRRAGPFGSSCWDGGETSANSSTSAALEAIKNAEKGIAFEVVHYPRFGSPDFVVSAEKVEDALRICWSAGMRVKMAVETEDSSRMTWFQGTVAATVLPGSGPWCGSPWRMLQVTWDEPETLLNMKRVNPWQVEYISPTSHLHSAFPPPKKFKALQNSEMIADGDEAFCLPMTELARSMAGHMSSPILNYYSPFPASIQGTRQDHQFCIPSSSNSQSDKSFQMFTQLLNTQMEPELRTVSTVLNIGTPHSGNSSPRTQSSSVHLNGVDLVSMQGNNTSPRVGVNSFQLFGKIIHASDSIEGGSEAKINCTDGETNNVFREGSSVGNPSPRQNSVAEFMIISKEPQL